MSENKKKRDIISEQEFNVQMRPHGAISPQEESPGDSEEDAGSEFLMGLNYMPDEKNEFEGPGEEPGEIVFSDKTENPPKKASTKVIAMPETAKVISSGQPAPWSDLDTDSDSH